MPKFDIQDNDVVNGVRCFDLIDTGPSLIVGEIFERDDTSTKAFPLAPQGRRNAVVMAYAWDMYECLALDAKSLQAFYGLYSKINAELETADQTDVLETLRKAGHV